MCIFDLILLDIILTDEWTSELAKHENAIKELERKYTEKCKASNVSSFLQNQI